MEIIKKCNLDTAGDCYIMDNIADIGEFDEDWINPNYVNLKITSKTLKAFASTSDGQRMVKIRKKYKDEDLFSYFCKSCKKFGEPVANETNENYRKGFTLTKEELEDVEVMKGKKKGLYYHFQRSPQHFKAEIKFIIYKNNSRHTLLLKMDIYYHMALNPKASKRSFEGQIIIIYNEKTRSNCKCKDCCSIGKKQLSKYMFDRWQELTFEYLRMQLLYNMSQLGTVSHNIIFFSVTMDGYDIGLCICLFCFFICLFVLYLCFYNIFCE